MRNIFSYLWIFLSVGFLTSCTPVVNHANSFYNYNGDDYPVEYLPIIEPVYATRERSSKPWSLELLNNIWGDNSKDRHQYFLYTGVPEFEKFAVQNGVIMIYSAYVDPHADAYVQDNSYHWFVMVVDKYITQGFQTEEEFCTYIQTLGIVDPDWQTPDDAFDQFLDSGCLAWYPDCK